MKSPKLKHTHFDKFFLYMLYQFNVENEVEHFMQKIIMNCEKIGNWYLLALKKGGGVSGRLGQIPNCFRKSEMDGSPKFYSCFHKDLGSGHRLGTKYEPSTHVDQI